MLNQKYFIIFRIANSLKISPFFLEKAGEIDDALEQMKYVNCTRFRMMKILLFKTVGFLVSQLHLNIGQRKPFNPILGETFQGTIDNKSICFEQISHHPPISYFHVTL